MDTCIRYIRINNIDICREPIKMDLIEFQQIGIPELLGAILIKNDFRNAIMIQYIDYGEKK